MRPVASGEWGRVREVLGNPHKPRCGNLFRMMQMMDQEEGDCVGYLNIGKPIFGDPDGEKDYNGMKFSNECCKKTQTDRKEGNNDDDYTITILTMTKATTMLK